MNRLFVNALKSVGLVGSGDDPEATVTFWKSADLNKRTFSQEQREALAEKGQALPDGSFPIVTKSDLQNAVQAFGRASNKAAARKHIISRARALGAVEILPDSWNVSKMTGKAESLSVRTGAAEMQIDLSAIEDAELRKSIEDAVSALTDEVETLKAQLEEEPPDPLEKAAPEVKAMIEKEREEREKLQKELADERQERREAEFIAKAKPLGVVVGKAEEAGPLLASIADKAPEEYEKLEPMLKQAATLLNKSGLFKEFGAGEGEGETDPVQRRDAWVEKNRKDGETVAQARSRFWKENPEAVEEARS